jgi:D-alanine-D-alanine ligase
MKIGITYNLKDEGVPLSAMNGECGEEFDTVQTINAIRDVFEKNGFKTAALGNGLAIVDSVRVEKPDFVFNIAEGSRGRNRESQVPSILEMLNIPYSGSDPLTLGMTLDKVVTKKIARYAKIPVPPYITAEHMKDLPGQEEPPRYPVITKPAWEGSSKGIYNSSKALCRKELEINVKDLLEKYPGQPVLVEEYVKGREITVGVMGNGSPRVLGIMEAVNKNEAKDDFFYSLEIKRDWRNLVDYVSPPRLPGSLENKIKKYAITAFKEFGCRDIARIDFKISAENQPFLLEINPLPGLSPESGDLVIMARKNGIEYEDLILSILDNAFSRYDIRAR